MAFNESTVPRGRGSTGRQILRLIGREPLPRKTLSYPCMKKV